MPGVVCSLIPLNLFDFDSLSFFFSFFSPPPSHSQPAPFISSLTGSFSFFFSSFLDTRVYTVNTRAVKDVNTHTHFAHMQYKWYADFSSFTEVKLLFSHSGKMLPALQWTLFDSNLLNGHTVEGSSCKACRHSGICSRTFLTLGLEPKTEDWRACLKQTTWPHLKTHVFATAKLSSRKKGLSSQRDRLDVMNHTNWNKGAHIGTIFPQKQSHK